MRASTHLAIGPCQPDPHLRQSVGEPWLAGRRVHARAQGGTPYGFRLEAGAACGRRPAASRRAGKPGAAPLGASTRDASEQEADDREDQKDDAYPEKKVQARYEPASEQQHNSNDDDDDE